MKRFTVGVALALALPAGAAVALAAEQVPLEADHAPIEMIAHARRLDVDVWINKDEGGIYRPGESMRVYFRTNADGYVLVFNVDTEGYIHLIYPYGPGDSPFVEGGRPYRIPSRSDPYDLVADGPPGIEYVVAVASPYPFQNLPWYLSADRVEDGRPDGYDEDGDAWDTDAGALVGDPYVGIDRIIRRIVPPGREDRVATNETYFYIGRRVEYPRYVCADCHYHPYYFDPYLSACSVFEIRIDATWAHYAPIRIGAVRPRYIYRVRREAPTRYRQWKEQWSSLDGRATLRTRFLPERDARYRREKGTRARPVPPEFRDLRRRYREGRFWKGRDEILRLRERRDDVKGGTGRDRDAGDRDPAVQDRERRKPPEDRGGWRDRRRQNTPEDRGMHERPQAPGDRGMRERPQLPEDRGVRERRPPERDDRGDRGRLNRERDDGDRGNRERSDNRGNRKREDGGRGDREDRGRGHDDGDRGRGRDDRGDQGRGHDDRERPDRG